MKKNITQTKENIFDINREISNYKALLDVIINSKFYLVYKNYTLLKGSNNQKFFTTIEKPIIKSNDLKLIKSYLDELKTAYRIIISSKVFKAWKFSVRLKDNPELVKKGIKVFIKKGPKGFKYSLQANEVDAKLFEINNQYQTWVKNNWPTNKHLSQQKLEQKKLTYRPKISVVTPVYNPDKEWLVACIESVLNQTYDNWELCLADDKSPSPHVKEVLEKYQKLDKRIKVVFRKENGHISKASNSALELATGEFVALLDHDDEFAPNALFEVAKALNENKKLDLIYSDEDKLELDGTHTDPFFKPDWSPDLFLSENYICHLTVIRKKLIDKVKGFRVGYEGSQDYDLILRITELTKQIHHIQKILYSWRKIPGSTAAVYSVKSYANQASINSLNDALKRRKIKGHAENGINEGSFRVKYDIIGNPLVSIIIPTKDKVSYLIRCIESVFQKTDYKNYEIIIVDTGSIEKETHDYYKKIKNNKKIKIVNWNKPFNYSTVNNFGVEKAKGEYLLLLNNDTEVIAHEWINAMLEHAQRKEVGAVGAKLLYPTNKIQHAGVILGIRGGRKDRGIAGHAIKMYPDISLKHPLLNTKDVIRDYSAITAACIMIKKSKYLEVKGLDQVFRIAFNDVDFCLKLLKKGYYNVYTPYTKLYHHESVSVGTPQAGNRNLDELEKEVSLMISKWDYILEHDPFYNKNLTMEHEDFSLNI